MTEPAHQGEPDDREHTRRLDSTLRRLRDDLRNRIPAPPPASVQAAGRHRRRTRRAAIGGGCALVLAAAVGGFAALAPFPDRTVPPSQGDASSTPRAAPLPLDDAIAGVEWRTATIEIPPHPGCPAGTVSFAPGADGSSSDLSEPDVGPDPGGVAVGPVTGFPRMTLHHDDPAYGDLTGDGRAEAVLTVSCARDAESSLDGQGQLLAVARSPDGILHGLGYAGPRGGIYHGAWVTDRALYTEVHPWHGDTFGWAPGMALRYQWDGAEFSGPEPAERFPPIAGVDGDGAGPPVRLDAVAAGLGCPDGTVRFDSGYTATVDGHTYDAMQPDPVSSGPHLVDLDGSGLRRLLLAIGCGSPERQEPVHGLAVLERAEDGLRGISVLLPPANERLAAWEVAEPAGPDDKPLRLLVALRPAGQAGEDRVLEYQWDGYGFAPAGR